MAVNGTNSINAKFYGGGYDLTPYCRKVSAKVELETADDTTLTDAARTNVIGREKASMSFDGVYEGGADLVNDVMNAALGGAEKAYVLLPRGGGLARRGVAMAGGQTKYGYTVPLDDVVDFSGEAMSDYGMDDVHALTVIGTAITAAANGTAVNLGAAGTLGGAAYLISTAFTGTSDTVTIEDSEDGSTGWATIATFTAVTGITSERIAISGAIRQYVRAVTTGTFSSHNLGVYFSQFQN